MVFSFVSGVAAQEGILQLRIEDRFRVVEHENLRIRRDNRYIGLLYRESIGYYSKPDLDFHNKNFNGTLFIMEEMKRDNRMVSRMVQDVLPADFVMESSGLVRAAPETYPPLRKNFPVFPDEPVNPGDVWRAEGIHHYPDPSGGYLPIPFICEYRYIGEAMYQNRPVKSIQALYALRYRGHGGELESVQGSYQASISLFSDEKGGIFMNTRVETALRLAEGSTVHESGFILTWYDGLSGYSRSTVERRVEEMLDLISEDDDDDPDENNTGAVSGGSPGVDDFADRITVERRAEGVALGLWGIRFFPDSVEILPEERGRLDRLAEILREFKGRTFFAIGHTAAVGSVESQYILSVERAKKIIDELVLRGFDSKQFIYKGEGGTAPVADNDTEEGRAQNRRVEIVILDG